MSLTGKTKASSYKDLLQMNNSNNGVTTTATQVVDGEGTASCLYLGDDSIVVRPVNDDTTSAFFVRAKGGTPLLAVDTTNSVVRAGVGQNIVNTQYAYFGIISTNTGSAAFLDDTHHPLAFNGSVPSDGSAMPNFGTGTDPATTFTTAEGSATRASDIVTVMWRVPDNITIDEIKHFEGADTATGDTTRMHLVSYNFVSGATACLTHGVVVANTSADNVNAGSEQPYLKDWTIGTEDIDAGKVLLCMFKSDSINSDYSISVTIKYHLR
jgi:hypothetical protein